jgi:hypothetical protein
MQLLRIENDPDDNNDALTNEIDGRAEKASYAFGNLAEGVSAEWSCQVGMRFVMTRWHFASSRHVRLQS